MRGEVGSITNNRCVDYIFTNNIVTNSDNTTYPLFEQFRGIRTMTASFLQEKNGKYYTVPYEGDWVVGDRIFCLNDFSEGYMGKVCTESGTPGTWKYFGKIETV